MKKYMPLQKKIKLLQSIGVNPYEMPSFKNGNLKARDFPKFIDNIIEYVKKQYL